MCLTSMKPLHSPAGEPIHALLGFCNKLLQLQTKMYPGYRLLAAFDAGNSQRSELMPSYKKQRSPMPADLKRQIDLMHEAAAVTGVSGTGTSMDARPNQGLCVQ